MMLWNKQYQELDPVVSSVTAKLKGVALTQVPGLGDVVWDVVDYSGPAQVGLCPGPNPLPMDCLKLFFNFYFFSLGKEFILRGDECDNYKEPEARKMC